MKLDYLIDTNILISMFNQELAQPIPNGNIGYSVITNIEVLSFKWLSLIALELKSMDRAMEESDRVIRGFCEELGIEVLL